jgi:hypothetical protein
MRRQRARALLDATHLSHRPRRDRLPATLLLQGSDGFAVEFERFFTAAFEEEIGLDDAIVFLCAHNFLNSVCIAVATTTCKNSAF